MTKRLPFLLSCSRIAPTRSLFRTNTTHRSSNRRPLRLHRSTRLPGVLSRQLPSGRRASSGRMTDKLPPNLLALFAPRPPLRYLPHCDVEPGKRRTASITGVAAFLDELQKPDPNYVPTESWLQRRDRVQLEKKEKQEMKIQEGLTGCMSPTRSTHHTISFSHFLFASLNPCANASCHADKPDTDPQIRGDPYRTLFISRLSYDVKEPDLEREFGRFGPIERVWISLGIRVKAEC
jgi:U1 small nuclear ribonucleoprotein